MTNKLTNLTLFCSALFSLEQSKVFSEPEFVDLIPNGNKNTCLNCHFTLNGGKNSLNYFGSHFFGNGRLWDSTLAILDSDSDGFTNGVELQDSLGKWTDGIIGDTSKVTIPGDPDSFPTSIEEVSNKIEISIHPIPAISSINFSIKNPNVSNLEISIFDFSGKLVTTFASLSSNETTNINWNLLDSKSIPVESGVYFIEVKSSNFFERKRFIITK